jgi:hypothetical protein
VLVINPEKGEICVAVLVAVSFTNYKTSMLSKKDNTLGSSEYFRQRDYLAAVQKELAVTNLGFSL